MQDGGGPIGARLTMAIARLVMQEWKENYDHILKKSNIEELLSGIYVDDGRSLHRKLKIGEWFEEENGKFSWKKENEEIDVKNELTREEVTRREILKAINSISPNLTFTMELSKDFEDLRLPTLSFSLWEGENSLEHSYYEKGMRNQTLVMERTSMSKQSIMSIMSNELVRRLEVLGNKIEHSEKMKVVEKYVQQLVNSEYSWKQIRDIIVSGIKGHKRKESRKKRNNLPRYRSEEQSLPVRMQKKLCEKYNWFKRRKESDEIDQNNEKKDENKRENKWNHYAKKKPPINVLQNEEKDMAYEPAKAVIFVQNTLNGGLAQELRKVIQALKPWTGLSLKVVERAGDKLEDILHKSNPWEDTDCSREMCLTCNTSTRSEKLPFKNCKKRSIVYETWCEMCGKYEKEIDDNENELNSDKKRARENGVVNESSRFIYIGETARSAFERGEEHQKDLEHYRPKSHLLKHALIHHPEIEPNELKYGMKILSSHKTAFERQIREAVLIECNAGQFIMNSKVEYTRCSIPRIEVTIGNDTKRKDDEKIATEKELIEKIKKMSKTENKRLSSKVNGSCSVKNKKARVEIEIDDVTENAADDTTVTVEAKSDVMKLEEKPEEEANDTPVSVEGDSNVDGKANEENIAKKVPNPNKFTAEENCENCVVVFDSSSKVSGHLNLTMSCWSKIMSDHENT